MAAVAAGSIDIDKPGKYPVVLSDALLGKPSKELYTGIRYNHKPDPSSDSTTSMHLEPSDSTSYDLSFTDNSDRYSYHGARTSGDSQYVLIFDSVKKHFVLHRVDSTFDMNLVSAPWAQNASTLRSQYPQLETPHTKTPAQPPQRKPSKTTKKAATAAKAETQRMKVEKAEKTKKPKPPPSPEPEEESEDDVLSIEYPDAPSSQPYQYTATSTPVVRRDPSEDVSEEDSDADAEGEDDDMERNEDVDHLKLPSPANNNAGGLSDEEMQLDLEAELEQALKDTEGGGANESSESEEE
ncbi:hypothetical protein LSUB1_G007911 [Lachnellula subtilissima]|uniref:Transcription elongation factor Eaf N-terminal domain-containing protein n=1 Tax=Lachnellula subtilissima TaxID=602034 RepID=A0A8H8U730_9HELO|nr:hypothetical protein LSUB1_G007911 [Lachnellula subtilissima]